MGLFAEKRQAPRRIAQIRCDVVSCAYHDGDHFCTAERVKIGPGYAEAVSETVCATYLEKGLSRAKRSRFPT